MYVTWVMGLNQVHEKGKIFSDMIEVCNMDTKKK